MSVLPPGTLLQLMYLRERLRALPPGRFIEIGPGAGHISALLLALGWQGSGYEFAPPSAERLRQRFAPEIAAGRYLVAASDWLEEAGTEPCDLVLSCMVMEHLDTPAEQRFLGRARASLRAGGRMIAIVPASPAHWGIEDEIAGHYRRYTLPSAQSRFSAGGFRILHAAGLTFPVSNLLLPLSNALVRRSEAAKLSLSMLERTRRSGMRDVPMKTRFPAALGLLLNPVMLYPLHLLQKLFRHSPRALVLYLEAEPGPAARPGRSEGRAP